jgi:hypothetical protein
VLLPLATLFVLLMSRVPEAEAVPEMASWILEQRSVVANVGAAPLVGDELAVSRLLDEASQLVQASTLQQLQLQRARAEAEGRTKAARQRHVTQDSRAAALLVEEHSGPGTCVYTALCTLSHTHT